MNVDEQTLVPIKATFMETTIRFDLSSNTYGSLLAELKKRFPSFHRVQYVDDEGDTILMSTDSELHQAIALSKGTLKLVLAENSTQHRFKQHGRRSKTPDERIQKWLQRQEPERQEEWAPHLLALNEMGFHRFRHNLKTLRSQQGDLQKTIEVLNARKETCDERLKHRELKKLERGAKRTRCSEKDDKHARKRHRAEKKEKKEKKPRDPQDPQIAPALSAETDMMKHYRDVAKDAFIELNDTIPSDKFTHLFVDGNNMFYLTNKLREFTLHGNTKTTEKILTSVARFFSELVRLNTEVIFDAASSISAEENAGIIPLDNGSTFLVSSARPTFPTSDAKLVAWARANPDLVPRTLVVTSDRALAGELHGLGVSVVRPGTWLSFVAKTVSGSTGPDVDWKAWLDAWIDKVTSE